MFRDWQPRALDLYVAEGLFDRPDGQVELKCAPRTEAAVFAATLHSPVWECPERVKAPTLLLWARRGDFPRSVFERFARRLPRGRLEELDTGHLAPMEAPEELVEAVLRFARPQESTSTG